MRTYKTNHHQFIKTVGSAASGIYLSDSPFLFYDKNDSDTIKINGYLTISKSKTNDQNLILILKP